MFIVDSSSNSECDHFGMSSPDIQGHMKNALEVAQNSMDTNTKVSLCHVYTVCFSNFPLHTRLGL